MTSPPLCRLQRSSRLSSITLSITSTRLRYGLNRTLDPSDVTEYISDVREDFSDVREDFSDVREDFSDVREDFSDVTYISDVTDVIGQII